METTRDPHAARRILATLALLLAVVAPNAVASAARKPAGTEPCRLAAGLAVRPLPHADCYSAAGLAPALHAATPTPAGAASAFRRTAERVAPRRVHAPGLRRAEALASRIATSPVLSAALTGRLAGAAVAVPGHPGLEIEQLGPDRTDGEVSGGSDRYVYNQTKLDRGGLAGFGMGASSAADRCPSGVGEVPAHAAGHLRYHLEAPLVPASHRLRTVMDFDIQATMSATAHVGADALLRDYDLQIDSREIVDVRVLGPAGLTHGDSAHEVSRLRAALVHIGADESMSGAFGAAHHGFVSFDPTKAIPRADAQMALTAMMLSDLQSSFQSAQRNWLDRAACLKVTFTPPTATVEPRASTDLTATVTSLKDGQPVAIDLATRAGTGTTSPSAVHAAPGAPARFTYTAPAQEQNQDVALVSGTSPAGRLDARGATITVKAPQWPLRFKVVSASLTTEARGGRSGGADVCSAAGYPTSATTDFGGSADRSDLAAQPVSQILRAPDGRIAGGVRVRVPTRWDYTVHGCTIDDNGNAQACTKSLPSQTPQPDGAWPIGFSLGLGARDGGIVPISWMLPDPETAGAVETDPNAICNVIGVSRGLSQDERYDQIPIAKLMAKGAQTFEFSGDRHWDKDVAGQAIDLTYTYDLSITTVRVDASGNELK